MTKKINLIIIGVICIILATSGTFYYFQKTHTNVAQNSSLADLWKKKLVAESGFDKLYLIQESEDPQDLKQLLWENTDKKINKLLSEKLVNWKEVKIANNEAYFTQYCQHEDIEIGMSGDGYCDTVVNLQTKNTAITNKYFENDPSVNIEGGLPAQIVWDKEMKNFKHNNEGASENGLELDLTHLSLNKILIPTKSEEFWMLKLSPNKKRLALVTTVSKKRLKNGTVTKEGRKLYVSELYKPTELVEVAFDTDLEGIKDYKISFYESKVVFMNYNMDTFTYDFDTKEKTTQKLGE